MGREETTDFTDEHGWEGKLTTEDTESTEGGGALTRALVHYLPHGLEFQIGFQFFILRS